jgi:hypothetical protein
MKALKTIQLGAAWLSLVLVIAISGCNSSSQDQQANTEAADTIAKEVVLSPEAQSILYSFPTPFEVTTMLEKAKAGFIFDITNPPANVDKYSTEISKALNLGVYSADLCYSATYNRTDETNKFLGCTNKLADGLGIAGVYDQSLVDKVKTTGNNKDSLAVILNRVFTQTNTFLAQNNRTKIAVLIACGGFAEALYLVSTLAEVAKDNSKIMAIVAGQKENHMKLLTILEAYTADESMQPIYADFQKLKPIWGNYGIDSGKKIEQQKVIEISDLAESVRLNFTK